MVSLIGTCLRMVVCNVYAVVTYGLHDWYVIDPTIFENDPLLGLV